MMVNMQLKKKNLPAGSWTFERCRDEAEKYRSRYAFQQGSASAYTIAVKRGWLGEICGHMVPRNSTKIKWTKDTCRAAASEFRTRGDFRRGNRKAYAAASKKGWLDEICAHMPTWQDWTIEVVAALAAPHKGRSAFARSEAAAYIAAQRRGWLDAVCSHMGPSEKLKVFSRQVYVIRAIGERRVYVGLSVDVQRRYANHKLRGVEAVREMLAKPHRVLVVSPRIPSEQAADLEKRLVERFRELGWGVVNATAAGGLGSAIKVWTPDALKAEALRYDSIKEFRAKSASAYSRVAALGMVDVLCSHMSRGKNADGHWTREAIMTRLAEAPSRKEAGRGRFKVAHNYASKMGILQEALAHLPKYGPRDCVASS